ncbi:adenosylcobinamide-GDP ribazoletransferase [Vibrio astriarenae]
MVKFLKYQWELFWLALGFFSRIPIPQSTPYSEERMNRSGRYFPLVGLALGTIVYAGYWAFSYVLPNEVAVLLTMILSVLLTGAFHEDGLADMADGIGGGMTVERRLEIMKDSRLGTYGTITVILALFLKWQLLVTLFGSGLISPLLVLLIGYGLSRAVAVTLIYDMTYVTDSAGSKSRPLAQRQTLAEFWCAIAIGVTPLIGIPPVPASIMLISMMILRALFQIWLDKRLGGFTGDCLGAVQQVSELTLYIIMLMMIQ